MAPIESRVDFTLMSNSNPVVSRTVCETMPRKNENMHFRRFYPSQSRIKPLQRC